MDRFDFVRDISSNIFGQMISLIQAKKPVILDFGRYGQDTTAYLFVANIVVRRLYNLYTEKMEELPRLVVFLEEAHKFLDPKVASYTIFDKLARETRKFNLILSLIDQRPSRIDDEVRSQLANRLILSLKEPSDIASALAGIPDRSLWEGIVGAMPPRTMLAVGDAIRVPTMIDIMDYNVDTVKRLLGGGTLDSEEIRETANRADEIFE
jgi:hypothetical protein